MEYNISMETKQNSQKSTKKSSTSSYSWQMSGAKEPFSGKQYILLFLAFLGLLALAIFVMQSLTFAILIVVSAVALLVYRKRSASVINYSLSQDGVSIDGVLYTLDKYKAFGVIENLNGSFRVILLPIKRIAPPLEIDFLEEHGEKIVDFFGARLPMKDVKTNFIDGIVQRIDL